MVKKTLSFIYHNLPLHECIFGKRFSNYIRDFSNLQASYQNRRELSMTSTSKTRHSFVIDVYFTPFHLFHQITNKTISRRNVIGKYFIYIQGKINVKNLFVYNEKNENVIYRRVHVAIF